MKFNRSGSIRFTIGSLIIGMVLTGISVPRVHGDGLFFIERPRLGLVASYEFEEEERETPGADTEIRTNDTLERVILDTRGWIYHENLFAYHLGFQPEWRQERTTVQQMAAGSDPTRRRNTSVLAYDADAVFFREKLLSLDLFADRDNRELDLSYTQDTEIDSRTWGGRLNFNSYMLPGSIGIVNRESTQTGFYPAEEDRRQILFKLRHNVKKSDTELDIRRDETTRQTRTGTDDFDTHSEALDGELINSFFFTGDERVRLDSLVYLTRSEYDDVDIHTLLVSENFFWTRQKMLIQSALYFSRREVDDFETEEKRINGRFTYRPGSGVTANVGAGMGVTDYSVGSEERYFGDVGVIYRRPVSWGNMEFTAGFDGGLHRRDGTGSTVVAQERHILSTGNEAVLTRDNIVVSSIVMTDTTGTIFYTENIDYRIVEVGPEVRITRVLAGGISDGQEIVVRYRFRVESGYNDVRFGQNYAIDLEIQSLLYVSLNHRRLDQSVLSGESPRNPVDDTFSRAGLRLDTGWSETRLEYVIQDRESGSSYVSRSVSQLFDLAAFARFSIHFSGRYGTRDFTDIDKKETFYTLGTDAVWRPNWWCTVNLVCLRNTVSGDLQDMTYTEIAPEVRFRYGIWTALMAFRMTNQEDHDFDNSLARRRVYFVVTRDLW